MKKKFVEFVTQHPAAFQFLVSVAVLAIVLPLWLLFVVALVRIAQWIGLL